MWLFSQEIQIGSKGNSLGFWKKRGGCGLIGGPRCPVKCVVQWKGKGGLQRKPGDGEGAVRSGLGGDKCAENLLKSLDCDHEVFSTICEGSHKVIMFHCLPDSKHLQSLYTLFLVPHTHEDIDWCTAVGQSTLSQTWAWIIQFVSCLYLEISPLWN